MKQHVPHTTRPVYTRFRKTDDVFVPHVPLVRVPHVTVVVEASKRSSAAALVICLLLGSLFFSAGKQLGTVAYFSDRESTVGNIFQAGEWAPPADPFDIVLNEFLPNPDDEANGLNFGDDADNKPLGEWIELYNKGDVDQDIAGWYMTDASGGVGNTHAVIDSTNTNTGSTIIPAHGWLVVYMNKPSLNNTGDEIYLYSLSDVQIDFYSYDDPSDFCEFELTPGDQNNGNGSGVPGNGPNADCPQNQVAPNKSYARIPDGTGAFVDPIPTPGSYNIPEEPVVQQSAGTTPPSSAVTSDVVAEETPAPIVTEVPAPVEETHEEPVVEETTETSATVEPTSEEEPIQPLVETTESTTIDAPTEVPPPTEPAPEPAPQPEPSPEPPPEVSAEPAVE